MESGLQRHALWYHPSCTPPPTGGARSVVNTSLSSRTFEGHHQCDFTLIVYSIQGGICRRIGFFVKAVRQRELWNNQLNWQADFTDWLIYLQINQLLYFCIHVNMSVRMWVGYFMHLFTYLLTYLLIYLLFILSCIHCFRLSIYCFVCLLSTSYLLPLFIHLHTY